MIENIIGWLLIGIFSVIPLSLVYLIYRKYKRYQENQTQLLYYKQKMKEEYLRHQTLVCSGEETNKKSQIISTKDF